MQDHHFSNVKTTHRIDCQKTGPQDSYYFYDFYKCCEFHEFEKNKVNKNNRRVKDKASY